MCLSGHIYPRINLMTSSAVSEFWSVWTTIWFIPLLNSDHLVLLWQIDGKIWESMARDREVSGMSTEGSNIQTFIDEETDTFSSTK